MYICIFAFSFLCTRICRTFLVFFFYGSRGIFLPLAFLPLSFHKILQNCLQLLLKVRSYFNTTVKHFPHKTYCNSGKSVLCSRKWLREARSSCFPQDWRCDGIGRHGSLGNYWLTAVGVQIAPAPHSITLEVVYVF